ncbi:MAG: hypothetical protein HYW03_02380 [Deltaproteobacteria bacterium]|nr:hypothetical protein [Deltaproteobacteria bacterium]MBI3064916.1 hypothetical protein [Deltaproteobacteria bacterium]
MKKQGFELIAVRIKHGQRVEIDKLSEKHEMPASIIIRKALDAGLRDFEKKALVAAQSEARN